MKKWKGQGLVEFALVLPILLLIIFGIIETALVIQGYLAVQHAAREAARFAVSYQPVRGACVDLDGDGMLEDGINDDDPPAGDGGDPDDLAPKPFCPMDYGANCNESDKDYYERRVKLVKLEARRAAAGLRINSYDLENDDFDLYGDEPCFFGVKVWGYPSFETDCNDPALANKEWNPDHTEPGCLDHPGLEGLPVLVFVEHNVEILDPFYRAIVGIVPVQAQAQMINEGVQVGFGDIPPPEFIINPGEREEPDGGDGCIVVLSPQGATNILPDDTNHVFTATVTEEGQPVPGKTVHFSTSAGEFDGCGDGPDATDGTTNAQGQVSVTICKDSKGTANIHAWVDDGGSDWATKTWIEEAEVYDIALSPKDATNAMPGDRSHVFVATVTDKQGDNVEGARVGFSTDLGAFDFSGVESRYAEETTNADGQASVTVYGNYSGTATIHAWVEYGAVGSLDPGEPYDVATKTWTVSGPYITVSNHEVIPLDYIYADVMDHDPAGTYDLWWCVISGTATSVVVSDTFDVDAGGDAENLGFHVPLGSKGLYRLETHPSGGGEDCDDTPVAHSADIHVLEAPPDLTIASFDVPALVCPETVFVMSAVVANDTGGSTDRTFDVDFYVDPTYTPPQSPVGETKQWWVEGIGPNERVTVTTVMWVDSPGEHTIWARVDTSDYVEEREPVGEANNVEEVTIIAAPSGCRYPAANAPAGGDGFENHPDDAYTDGGGYAESRDNGGTDQHQYYNFDFDIPGGTTVEGIEVRLDWWLDGTGGDNSIGVELSWDGGAHWTPVKTDSTVTTTEHTAILGGPDDTWGRTWLSSDFTDSNFRVRVSTTSSDPRDFYLDWIAVRVIGPLECDGWPKPSPWGGGGGTPGQVRCDQLLRLGDFESTPFDRWDKHWNAGEEDDAWQCPTDRAYGGSGYTMRLNASLGSREFGCPPYHPYLWQRTLAIPQEVYTMTTMHVRGQWWVDISTTDCCTPTTDTDDVLYLKMRDSGGIDLGTPTKIVTGGVVSSDWEQFEVDVTDVVDPYNRAGEEVQVYFDATHDEDEDCTWFYLDELECEVCTYWGIPDPEPGTASIGGDVRVLVGGIPKMLPGVDVWAYSQGGDVYHTVTIQDGTYHFYNIPPDTYIIYAEEWVGQGLYSETKTETVVADERNYDVDLLLL